jgi:hypothetical protein
LLVDFGSFGSALIGSNVWFHDAIKMQVLLKDPKVCIVVEKTRDFHTNQKTSKTQHRRPENSKLSGFTNAQTKGFNKLQSN